MDFNDFKERLLPMGNCEPAPEEVLSEFKRELPPALLREWGEWGWCGYGDGLLWFDDPRKYSDLIDVWTKGETGHIVFARTAFGDLFSIKDSAVYCVMTQYGECDLLVPDVAFFGSHTLRSKPFLEGFMSVKLFTQAREKLGILKADECYAFVPALALGGEAKIENIKIAKLMEYLEVLSQLN